MVQDLIVRFRGLPFSCTESQLREWLGELDKDVEKVAIGTGRDGRPTGEGFVAFKTQSSYDLALKKDRENMGSRYIEAFAGTAQDKEILENNGDGVQTGWEKTQKSSNPSSVPSIGYVVRMRGLPFKSEEADIKEFFYPLKMVENGIIFPLSRSGKSAGEAYVVFPDRENASEALKRDRANMKHRYIEVFKSTHEEMNEAVGWGAADEEWGSRGGGNGGPMDRRMMRGGDDYGYGGMGRYGAMGGGARARPTPYERSSAYGGNTGSIWGGQNFDYPEAGGYGGARGVNGWSGGASNFGYDRDSYSGDFNLGDPWATYSKDPYNQAVHTAAFSEGPRPLFENWRGSGPEKSAFGGNRRYVLKMRGIPFKAVESDIHRFFGDNQPSFVEILYESNGRPAGEARVEFADRQAYDQALQKDKEYMGSRYVELFPDSSPNRF